VGLFQTVDGLGGFDQGWLGFFESDFALSSQLLSSFLLDIGLLFLLIGLSLFDLSNGILLGDLCDELIGFVPLGLDLNHLILELLLEPLDLGLSLRKNLETQDIPLNLPINLASLLIEQCLVERDQLEERFGSGVVVTTLELPEDGVGLVDRGVCLGHVYGDLHAQVLVLQWGFLQEFVSDVHQRVFGPWVEPVDGRGVDDTWELTGADTHRLAHRREAQNNLQVLFHLVVEEAQQVLWGIDHTLAFSLSPDIGHQSLEVLLREQIGNPP
jgi:hypothetical protein